TLSTVSVQARNYLDGRYTGGPGPSNWIGKPMKKKAHSDWVTEDMGCGNNCSQPDAPKKGAPGFSFKLLTIQKRGRFATVKSEPFGVFVDRQECEIARAQKIAQLDANNDRQGNYIGQTVPVTRTQSNWHGVGPVLNGTTTSITADEPTGPFQKMDVTFCEPGIFVVPNPVITP